MKPPSFLPRCDSVPLRGTWVVSVVVVVVVVVLVMVSDGCWLPSLGVVPLAFGVPFGLGLLYFLGFHGFGGLSALFMPGCC